MAFELVGNEEPAAIPDVPIPRALALAIAIVMIALGVVVLREALRAPWLFWWGTETDAVLVACEDAGEGGDSPSSVITYRFDSVGTDGSRRATVGRASIRRCPERGEPVAIVYLAAHPEVSNLRSEVRLGALLGPIAALIVSAPLVVLGVGLIGIAARRRRIPSRAPRGPS